jgi:hypothetical protein
MRRHWKCLRDIHWEVGVPAFRFIKTRLLWKKPGIAKTRQCSIRSLALSCGWALARCLSRLSRTEDAFLATFFAVCATVSLFLRFLCLLDRRCIATETFGGFQLNSPGTRWWPDSKELCIWYWHSWSGFIMCSEAHTDVCPQVITQGERWNPAGRCSESANGTTAFATLLFSKVRISV